MDFQNTAFVKDFIKWNLPKVKEKRDINISLSKTKRTIKGTIILKQSSSKFYPYRKNSQKFGFQRWIIRII